LASTYIDDTLKYLGIKALRSNSIFATSNQLTSSSYARRKHENFGGEYVIFPIDGFEYCWSRISEDLFIENYDLAQILGFNLGGYKNRRDYESFFLDYVPGKKDYDKIQHHYQFTDSELERALNIKHEVWLHTDYYALNKDLCQDIFKRLGLQI
jgi:hypothetical protein